MKRIVFLDYVRVFACFLVMVVHASENFYGAPGSTDMVGPQAFLANESDRLWVSIYDGFSRMAVPLFIIVSAFLLAPMKEGQTMWQFYRRRCIRILPPFFIFMILYSTLPMLWGQIDGATSIKDLSRIFLNFPTLAGHLWFMYPLISIYLFIPIISPWLSRVTVKEERFFIGLFLLSTCMPYLNRWFGEVYFILNILTTDVSFPACILIMAFTSLFANLFFFSPMQLGAREGGFALAVGGLAIPGAFGVYTGLITRVRELIWIVIGVLLMKVGNGTPANK